MEERERNTSSGANQPKNQRLIRVDQIYSRKDRQMHFVPTKKPEKTKDKFSKTVLVIRRIISNKGMVVGTEVDIKSPALKDIFLEIYAGVEGLKLNKTPSVAKPELFFHARKEFEERLKTFQESASPEHALENDIAACFDFIKEYFSDSLDSLDSLLEVGEITYDLVWALFPYNILMFTTDNTLLEPQVFTFRDGEYVTLQNGTRYYLITGRIVNHNGVDFGYGDLNLRIPAFDGSRKITSLTAFPLAKHSQQEHIQEQMIERGRKFAQFVSPFCQEYTGMAVKEEQTPKGPKEVLFEATGRIMADPVAFRLYKPNWMLILTPWVTITLAAKDLRRDQLLICSPRIPGFSLARKQWGSFAISSLQNVVWDETAFTKLIIEPKRRDLICSLVKSHRSDADGFDDIIRDKGRGLVGLLSGGPGVGKTLTAEVVAELTHRPLYMISAGELGIDLEKVDRQLQMVLDITKRWGCVLLIDEADVFLQARSDMDLLRNALVSIFLRRLEYFQGILILTTNRKRAIDPAFQSRIHFKIHYPSLTEAGRAQLWKDFLSKVPPGTKKPNLSDQNFSQLAKMSLNGREIKNSISCAFSMSRESGEALTVDRLEEVLSILIDSESTQEI